MKHSVLIVEDQPCTARGLQFFIESEEGLEVVAVAKDATNAYQLAAQCKPEVAVVDSQLAESPTGITVIEDLRRLSKQMAIVLNTRSQSPGIIQRAIDAGADACVSKLSGADELSKAIRRALCSSQGTYLSPRLSSLGSLIDRLEQSLHPYALSSRELEVFQLSGQGKGRKDISELLSITPATVSAHKCRIKKKLGCSSQHEVQVRAIKYLQWVDKPTT